MTIKRLFFGLEVKAPWAESFPAGRILPEEGRHATLVFLGNIPYEPLEEHLSSIPLPTFRVGLTGHFDKLLFLPENHPKVVAWRMKWFDPALPIHQYQKTLIDWLESINQVIPGKERSFLPHATIARHPFSISEWKKTYSPLFFYTGSLHLYESVGTLHYVPLWSHEISAPFTELEHTADIAFTVRGESLQQLFIHAQSALGWKVPSFIPYVVTEQSPENLDEIVISLNKMISLLDKEKGCPLKAVSFHGEIKKKPQGYLEWEMIVDV